MFKIAFFLCSYNTDVKYVCIAPHPSKKQKKLQKKKRFRKRTNCCTLYLCVHREEPFVLLSISLSLSLSLTQTHTHTHTHSDLLRDLHTPWFPQSHRMSRVLVLAIRGPL